jgi:hypothetical protein
MQPHLLLDENNRRIKLWLSLSQYFGVLLFSLGFEDVSDGKDTKYCLDRLRNHGKELSAAKDWSVAGGNTGHVRLTSGSSPQISSNAAVSDSPSLSAHLKKL